MYSGFQISNDHRNAKYSRKSASFGYLFVEDIDFGALIYELLFLPAEPVVPLQSFVCLCSNSNTS
jgi:hypothetical protein